MFHSSTRLRGTVLSLFSNSYRAVALFAVTALVGARAAETVQPSAVEAEPTAYDKIWAYGEPYNNSENPVIQRFALSGRFQLDYGNISSDQGSYDEWNIRRFRLGGKMRVFEKFTVHVETDLNPQEPRPFYRGLTDTYIAWSPQKSFVLTVGKQSVAFTMDGSTSSKQLLTIDRNNLANNLWFSQEYIPGITAGGQKNNWVYQIGMFSSGGANGEFGNFSGGVFGLGTIGYDFAGRLDVKKALLRANYLYNEQDSDNGFTRPLKQVASLNFDLDWGRYGVRTDLAAGAGYLGQSDLWGAMAMPYYNITDDLQVVTRYAYVSSDDPDGVRLSRYSSQFVQGNGDDYHEVYLGVNYYLHGHKLKVQTGVNYVNMRDRADNGGGIEGWDWTTGLRVSW